MAQPISAVEPVSDIVRQEVIALFAESRDRVSMGDDVRLGMDLVEISQEVLRELEDEAALVRISPAVPV
jgi:hypothetical protein